MDYRPLQSPIRNQQDRSTCVAFAVSAAHEWDAADDVVRSVEDVMWAGHQVGGIPGREEISVQWALEGLNAYRHATEEAWPYCDPHWTQGRPTPARNPTNQLITPRWRRLDPCDFDDIVTRLGDARPVILTIQFVPAAWLLGGGTVDALPGKRVRGGHAVLVVGVVTGPGTLIVKNSWGPQWGADGYGFITRRYVESYGVVAHSLTKRAAND